MTVKKSETPDPISLMHDEELNDHVASLRYAGMIQRALMPDPDILKRYIKDLFVLFLPRNIVSGDFYYSFYNRKIICIAVGDCTGHGVPGALMSILGLSFLNEILQSGLYFKSNRILNLMREKVMKALNQTGSGSEKKDSIDIGLCLIDCLTGKMQYSGANRPLLMVRDGILTEFKPDKMTIGIAPLKESPFSNISIETRPGDTFYLFSDGYSDQFGEITDKKFKHKYFKKLIESVHTFPLDEQKKLLEQTFNEWKGEVQQIDDVLIFGFQM